MLQDKFAQYIAQTSIVNKSQKLLLAVSGGVDSSVMLDLFVKAGYNIAVAHCNFQLRGMESVEDEESVARKCAEYGVVCYNKRFETQKEIDESGDSLQMVARRLRYDWFEQLRAEHGLDKVVIAHNADDAIETFFINMLRGCGIKGFTGINAQHGDIVRPLLFAHRRDIVEYALANKVSYREDSSNSSTKYVRNKLRLAVIPKFKEIMPKFPQIMIGNIGRLVECQEFVSKQIDLISAEITSEKFGHKVINIDGINPTLPKKFVLWEMLQPLDFNAVVVENIYNSYTNHESGRKFYAPQLVAYLDRNELTIKKLDGEEAEYVQTINTLSEEVSCPNYVLEISTIDRSAVDVVKRPANCALVDADLLSMPLTVRRWRAGDSFVPFGMSGHKKVSDYLIDQKVSMLDKERQMVLVSGDEIVWLIGHRIDDRFKITDTTKRCAEFAYNM